MKIYTASKSRSQGREAWSVIFRHPARIDPTTGQGRRIRRGLGTSDAALADELVDQLNAILADHALWDAAQRPAAAARFDARVVDIFFHGLEPTRVDYRAVRDALMPLPGVEQDYRHVLMLGTTGAGKTTLVRQLLGHRRGERFPSTSTAKTTVADTEIVLSAEGPFKVVASFASRDEVVDHLTDNVSAAAVALFGGKPDSDVLRRLLDHVNQRFRFSYVLGRPRLVGGTDAAADEDELDGDLDLDEELDEGDEQLEDTEVARSNDHGESDGADDPLDLQHTHAVVLGSIEVLREVVRSCADDVRASLNVDDSSSDDERVLQELLEETLDFELRSREAFHGVVDSLMEEIEARFAVLTEGDLQRNRQGWPVTWSFEHADRAQFLRRVASLSSNYAPAFGRILTPLINGLRVSGPFRPEWMDGDPRLVLIDVEGLGHTAKSARTLSTSLAKRLEEVDEVVLVDNATQPMQAAPLAAMKTIAVSGNADKLSFVFTHFDLVKGPNMQTFGDAEEHVLASAENTLAAIEDDLGSAGEQVLRRRLEGHRYFVGGIQDDVPADRKAGRRTLRQLQNLVVDLGTTAASSESLEAQPVLSRMNLSLAVAEAARTFQERWRGLLGLEYSSDNPKEHWTRIKALTRRLGEGWDDHYDDLMPVAELRNELHRQLFLMLQRPARWEGEPSEDAKYQTVQRISNAFAAPLFALTTRRLKDDVQTAWLEAYALSGRGSTFVRARHVADRVYGRGAPVPTVAASPEGTEFLREVASFVEQVAADLGLVLE